MADPAPERASAADLALPATVTLLLLAGLAVLRGAGFGTSPVLDSGVPVVADVEAAASEPSDACVDCHAREVEAWRSSHHAAAQTPFGPEHGGPDAPSFSYRGRPVAAVGRIGVDPLVQWLVDVGGGRIQASQIAEYVPTGEVFDVFADGREPGEWAHWTGGGMTWNRSCAACHATEVRKGFEGATYRTTFAEPRVGCGACHGDASGHVRGDGSVPHDATGRSGASRVDTCAPCHARRAELTDGWLAGAPLLDALAPALVDGGPGGLFYGDGQVRDEVFEWTAFASSRMHAAGVDCVDCHDPHSGNLAAESDALCLRCHSAMPGFEPHDLHEEGVGCVGCHMPVTTYMQRHPRHDHGFRLPDPITGTALGIPDACSRCHPDRDNVAGFVAAYGAHEVDARARAFVEGDTDALLAILEDPEQPPLWRASAAARAGSDRGAVGRLIPHLLAGDPLVRFGAWSGMGPWLEGEEDAARHLEAGLKDPSRAVRVAAARAGASRLARDGPEAEAYRTYLEHNADQPDALVEDASWALSRGDVRHAHDRLSRALQLDPRHLAALDGLAVILAGAGRADEAAATLERALALAPDDGELWARLGLARAQAGDATGAEVALLQAVDRAAPRAHYNLGLVLAQRGAHAEAVRHLVAAEEVEDGPDVRYAVASTLWQWGRRDEARVAAKRVLQLDPAHPGARQILTAP